MAGKGAKPSSKSAGKGAAQRSNGAGRSPLTLAVAAAVIVALAAVMMGGSGGGGAVAAPRKAGEAPSAKAAQAGGGSLKMVAPRLPALEEPRRWTVPCSSQYAEDAGGLRRGCHPEGECKRVVQDGFVNAQEVAQLRAIAAKGMAGRPSLGGPTIMDINTGYVRDDQGVVNLFDEKQPPRFEQADFTLYKAVIERIRQRVMAEFGTSELFFTAPTFITRLVGNASWAPAGIHDEYWHPHVDKNNTGHYDYSGLLYLADHKEDFTGGLFAYLDGDAPLPQAVGCYDHDIKSQGAPHTCPEYARAGYCKKTKEIRAMCEKSCKVCAADDAAADEPFGGETSLVEPSKGRLAIFSSGRENVHQVQKVLSGERLTMSMWFTCDKRKKFQNFLDGKKHVAYDAAE